MKIKPGATKTDPVCGMEVLESSAYWATRNGETFHFCSDECRRDFLKHPSEYLVSGSRHRMPDESADAMDPSSSSDPRPVGNYTPLLALTVATLLGACALEWSAGGGWSSRRWMSEFMGLFLIFFATLKVFDVKGFADGFQRYDLLAGILRPYAYLYPLIEFALGLAYLARWRPAFVAGCTVVVMVFGALGVLRSLRRGERLQCACMGSTLKVPLSRVALFEDLAMAAMAGAMLANGPS